MVTPFKWTKKYQQYVHYFVLEITLVTKLLLWKHTKNAQNAIIPPFFSSIPNICRKIITFLMTMIWMIKDLKKTYICALLYVHKNFCYAQNAIIPPFFSSIPNICRIIITFLMTMIWMIKDKKTPYICALLYVHKNFSFTII